MVVVAAHTLSATWSGGRVNSMERSVHETSAKRMWNTFWGVKQWYEITRQCGTISTALIIGRTGAVGTEPSVTSKGGARGGGGMEPQKWRRFARSVFQKHWVQQTRTDTHAHARARARARTHTHTHTQTHKHTCKTQQTRHYKGAECSILVRPSMQSERAPPLPHTQSLGERDRGVWGGE